MEIDAKARVEVQERYWELAKSYEREVEQEVLGGMATPRFLAGIRYLRLGAEIALLDARRMADMPTDDLAAAPPLSELPKPPFLEGVLGQLLTERPTAIQPRDDAERRLLKFRHNAALEELLWRYAPDPLGGANVSWDKVLPLLESELALATSLGQRVRVRRKIFDLAKIYERYAQAEYLEKRVAAQHFARAQYERFEAAARSAPARRGTAA